MTSSVWISTAPGHASNMRPFLNDIGERDPALLQQLIDRNQLGEPLAEDEFPKQIYGAPHAPVFDGLPNLFNGYGFWVISGAAKDVLMDFDLGGGTLRPVELLQNDKKTKIEGDWFCLSFGNRKSAFVPEKSPEALDFAGGRWTPPFVTKDGDMVVSEAALEGPDIWVDPVVYDAFFMSHAMGTALKKAKVDKGFFLKKSPVFAG